MDPQNPARNLDIYDGATGGPAKKIVAQWDSKFIWLSDESFAYSSYNQAWIVFQRADNGDWTQTRVIKRFGDGKLENLVATSPHSVAWRQENEIWTCDFDSGAPEKIWSLTTGQLETFSCADNGDLLLNCRDENGPLSIRLRQPELGEKQATVLAETRRLDPGSNVKLSEAGGQYTFLIMQNGGENSVRFVWDGMVESYALAGKFLYFVGNKTSDPPGIWRYGVNSKETVCVDSELNKPLKYARGVLPEVGTGTNAAGGQFTYHIWTPMHVKAGKKYPLIIGQTHYMWFSYEQIAPNAQWFFAFVDRPSWWDGLSSWKEDVTGLYSILARNPNIDTNRVFIFGTSAESYYLSRLLDENPGLFKGAILFDSGSRPDVLKSDLSDILVVAGGDDGDNAKSLPAYQDQAAKAGVPVTLILQDGAQHITRSVAAERQRARAFTQFLLENK